LKPPEVRARQLVDRMLREAAAAERYVSGGQERFFDIRSPEFRDGAELRALHFTETATKIGKAFRKANPLVPWVDLDQLRNDLVHEYPEVKADRVWRFVRDDLPSIVGRLRRAKYPPSEE
jgi:uncharacterized protein with HEPN domain